MNTLSNSTVQSWLSWFSRGILFLGFIFLFGRLFELQVIKGDYYVNLANENRIRRVVINSARGNIYARGGELLVGNKEVKKRVILNPDSGYVKTVDIDDAQSEDIIIEHDRYYPLASKFAHVSGYVGIASKDEVGKSNPKCLENGILGINALVGRGGLEEFYNCTLSGIDGEELIEVDTQGRRVRILGRKDPVMGSEIKTNIDYALQKKIAEIMIDKLGVVIVSDFAGEILAFYSTPSFDPNIFVDGSKKDQITNILSSPSMPLFNRGIGGLYHPGSVFKPLVAIAALEEGLIDEGYRYTDEGKVVVDTPYGEFSYANWYFTQYGSTEGEIGLIKALARSTDTFFYKVGEKLGPENISDWSKKFSLTGKTGIDLPGELEGLIPDPRWKRINKGEKWFLGNTYHMAIGQGDIAVSPMHIHAYITALASGSEYCKPRIVGEPECKDLGLNSENVELVKEGMMQACQSGGTGYTFFDSDPQVACKTGTAETPEKDVTHAWFTFFVSDEDQNSQIVVTVLIEKGGEGSSVAGPIAREIFDFYYSTNK